MTIALRHLVLLLLLQVHGLGETGPCLSLVPGQPLARSPECAIFPIAFRYHREVLAGIDLPQRAAALSPAVPAPPARPFPRAPERPRAVRCGPGLVYLFMSLTR